MQNNFHLPVEIKEKLRSYITSRCGLYFRDYGLKDLENAIYERMKANRIESVLSYYNHLIISDHREDEFRELLNLLTVNHTYFFRNEPQFYTLQHRIIPAIREKKIFNKMQTPDNSRPSIKIWSAGCATGEEPYSIAIVIKECIPDLENWDIQILATDVSMHALEMARAGIYGKSSVRSVPANYLAKYFTKQIQGEAEKFKINNEIKSMVQLDYFNLIKENYPKTFDMIFCRNVIIYFNLETTVRTIEKFSECLADDGMLFIGYSESLQFLTPKFRIKSDDEAVYYVKSDASDVTLQPSVEDTENIINIIAKAELEAADKESSGEPAHVSTEQVREIKADIVKNIFSKKYDDAMSLIEAAIKLDPDSPEPYYFAAQVLANQAKFTESVSYIEKSLAKDVLFLPSYFLLGSIHEQRSDYVEAERNYKKVLFLDSGFLLASFSLANIYKREGRSDWAIREFRNTIKLLGKRSIDDIIPYSGGFNAAALTSVCVNNIERLRYSL